jgi:hypothetical protein
MRDHLIGAGLPLFLKSNHQPLFFQERTDSLRLQAPPLSWDRESVDAVFSGANYIKTLIEVIVVL